MPTILIVDDDRGIQILLRDVLADAGFEAVIAGTMASALRALDEHRPDVIVLDLSLPDSSESRLRRMVALSRDARILVLSGSVQIQERASGLGADASLAKPFDLDAFVALVTRLCESAERREDVGPAA